VQKLHFFVARSSTGSCYQRREVPHHARTMPLQGVNGGGIHWGKRKIEERKKK
jgi:hypothetical protein